MPKPMTDNSAVLRRARQFGSECVMSGVPRTENPYAEAAGEMFEGVDEGRLRASLIAEWFSGWDEGARKARGRVPLVD
jgi:hypothetical protein